jgi:surface polysaccharide O-acyltransferase-like enzyme
MEESRNILLKSVPLKSNMNEKFKKNNQVVRNHGIDFIRIIAMYGIVINHIIYNVKTFNKYQSYKELKLLHILLFWHNNGFAFISGFIGCKKHRYSNLFYLWMCVFFYSVIIHFFYLKYKPQMIKDKLLYNFFPIIFKRYWFFTSYFGMYLFLPIINKGIAYLNKSELKICLISIIIIFVFWHDIMNLSEDIFNTNMGYSVLWLMIFYITGAYFGKYEIKFFGIKKFYFAFINFLIYISTSIIYYIIFNYNMESLTGGIKLNIIIILKQLFTENYDSNLKVIQSISIILFLLQINYNKYLGKIISFIGTLTFGVYLIHSNRCIESDILSDLFDNEQNNISVLSVYRLFMRKGLLLFIICIIIDYLRYLLFNLLKIRKICIIFDRKLFEILK